MVTSASLTKPPSDKTDNQPRGKPFASCRLLSRSSVRRLPITYVISSGSRSMSKLPWQFRQEKLKVSVSELAAVNRSIQLVNDYWREPAALASPLPAAAAVAPNNYRDPAGAAQVFQQIVQVSRSHERAGLVKTRRLIDLPESRARKYAQRFRFRPADVARWRTGKN